MPQNKATGHASPDPQILSAVSKMLPINNSAAYMATGASDRMGYFHETDLFTAVEVTAPLYWIPPSQTQTDFQSLFHLVRPLCGLFELLSA